MGRAGRARRAGGAHGGSQARRRGRGAVGSPERRGAATPARGRGDRAAAGRARAGARGRRRERIRIEVRFARRGLRRLEPPRLVLRDPLALAVRTLAPSDTAPVEVLVLPRTEPVEVRHERDAAGAGRALAALAGAAEVELDGLRAYRPGSPASRIHWPPLARGAGLLERRLRPDGDGRPLVVLDPRAPRRPEDLDAAVRAAASLVLALARAVGCAVLLPGERRRDARSSATSARGPRRGRGSPSSRRGRRLPWPGWPRARARVLRRSARAGARPARARARARLARARRSGRAGGPGRGPHRGRLPRLRARAGRRPSPRRGGGHGLAGRDDMSALAGAAPAAGAADRAGARRRCWSRARRGSPRSCRSAAFGALHWALLVEERVGGRMLAAVGSPPSPGSSWAPSCRSRAPRGTPRPRASRSWPAPPRSLAAGVPMRLLLPSGWGELGAGVSQGLQTLPDVRVPYAGVDAWPRIVILSGARCWSRSPPRSRSGRCAGAGPRATPPAPRCCACSTRCPRST